MHIKYIKAIAILFLIAAQCTFISYADDSPADENNNIIDDLATVDEHQNEHATEEVKVAPNLDLKKVAPPPEPVVNTLKENEETVTESEYNSSEETAVEEKQYPSATALKEKSEREKLVILGAEVPPGTSTRLAWPPQVSISGLALPTPVLVINGANPGPTLCLTGAIHGDELNSI